MESSNSPSFSIEEFRDIRTYWDLPEEEVSLLSVCIENAFGGTIDARDATQHMSGDQLLIAKSSSEESSVSAIGFCATKITTPAEEFSDEKMSTIGGLYFAAAAVDARAQGEGVYREMNRKRLELLSECGVDTIFTRTQNPRVEEGITHSIEELVRAKKIGGYAVDRVLVPAAYGHMLTASRPVSRTVSYDEIDYDRGDANLITWSLT